MLRRRTDGPSLAMQAGQTESTLARIQRKAKRRVTKAKFTLQSSVPSKATLAQSLKQTVREIKIRKVNFLLGFCACMIVVLTSSLMMSVLSNAPVAWLRLAELSSGEMDFTFSSSDSSGFQQLNYTLITDILKDNPAHSYHTPRYDESVLVWPRSACHGQNGEELDPSDLHWKYYGIGELHSCPVNGTSNDTTLTSSPSPSPSAENITQCSYCYEENQMAGQCFADACGIQAFHGRLLVIDSEKEKRIGIGREWDKGSIKPGSMYIHKTLAKSLRAQKGDIVYVTLGLDDFFPGLYHEIVAPLLEEYANDYLMKNVSSFLGNGTGVDNTTHEFFYNVFMPVKIQDIYDEPKGKHDDKTTDSIMMEYSTFLQHVVSNMHPALPADIRARWSAVSLYEYASEVVLNLPPPRIDVYLQNDNNLIRRDVITFGVEMFFRLGFSQMDTQVPVLDALDDTRFFSLFLGLILNVVICILLGLSVLLIYSLLMVNVETRTFEMGVMRLVGTTRAGIVQLLLFQAFSYAIPSWVFGLGASQVFMFFGSLTFKELTGVPISPWLTPISVIVGTILGLLIPVLSAILPIRHALTQNLHDSLDTKHAKVQAVSVTLERSEDASFSWSVIIVGGALAFFGFGIYYVMPLSLLTLNFSLLLNMFFLLLMGMLLGLVMLSLNVENLLEVIIVEILLFWEKTAIKALVLKNLVAHKQRNRKTTIMYALSLGFIIFITISYASILDGFVYAKQSSAGALVKVQSEAYEGDAGHRVSVGIANMTGLELVATTHPHIKGFSWVTREWEVASWAHHGVFAKNLGLTYYERIRMVSCSPNLLDVALSGFQKLRKGEPERDDLNLAQQLYTVWGSSRAWLGSKLIDAVGAEIGKPLVWEWDVTPAHNSKNSSGSDPNSQTDTGGGNQGGTPNINFGGQTGPAGVNIELGSGGRVFDRALMVPMALFDNSAVFKFSQYPTSSNQAGVVSHTTFLRHSYGYYYSLEDVPMGDMLIQLKDGLSDDEIDDVITQLTNSIRGQPRGVRVWDYRESVGPLLKASAILDLFFMFTTAVAMLIASFSLMSSMYTNIYEQTKEIGILRAIGISLWWMRRIYIYEAFTLVLASSMLGVIIGCAVGYTMLLQRMIFLELPLPFQFPWQIMLVVFLCSMGFALLSSLGPINAVMKRPIVANMRE